MNLQTVAEAWEEYHTQVYPTLSKDTHQYRELERTFYSGCLSMFSLLVEATDDDTGSDIVTEAEIDRVEAINTELHSYFIGKIREDTGLAAQ